MFVTFSIHITEVIQSICFYFLFLNGNLKKVQTEGNMKQIKYKNRTVFIRTKNNQCHWCRKMHSSDWLVCWSCVKKRRIKRYSW